jgi:hypothetical protein
MTLRTVQTSVIGDGTALEQDGAQRPLGPVAPPDQPKTQPRSCRAAVCYAAFTLYSIGVAVFSGLSQDRCWGICASTGYAAAAVIAAVWPARRGRLAALAAALAGALTAPLTWLAGLAPATPVVAVVTRSAALLLHHGSPYLPLAQLTHGGFLAYDPYLPRK